MFLGLAQGSGGGVRGLGGCWVGVPQGLGQRISGLPLPPIPPQALPGDRPWAMLGTP